MGSSRAASNDWCCLGAAFLPGQALIAHSSSVLLATPLQVIPAVVSDSVGGGCRLWGLLLTPAPQLGPGSPQGEFSPLRMLAAPLMPCPTRDIQLLATGTWRGIVGSMPCLALPEEERWTVPI